MPEVCAIPWCGALATFGRYCPVHGRDRNWKPGAVMAGVKPPTKTSQRGKSRGPQPVRLPGMER